MAKKNQSQRLTEQHKISQGVIGIFGKDAKLHDLTVAEISQLLRQQLQTEFPKLSFRYRKSISKLEINHVLQSLDTELGSTLFVENARIKPDGGILEVLDDKGKWRVILVSEAKHQGKDIENLIQGKLVGKNKNQDLMVAGNAIERAHKNISEIANFMLPENHFPYVLFLTGSNFLTQDVVITRYDGSQYTLHYDLGSLNRLDRLTAANYGLPINKNLCENKFIPHSDKMIMLQAASIYTQGNGLAWNKEEMFEIMSEIAKTSLRILGSDLFEQLTQSE